MNTENRFWSHGPAETFTAVGSSSAGLRSAEAQRRARRDGPNTVAVQVRRRLPARIARKLLEPLVAILLIAAAVAGATGDWTSFAIVTVVVIASVGLDVVQEVRAEAATDALKHSVAVRAAVRRDGAVRSVAVDRLVVGDVVELAAGNLVPADGVVIEARGLAVDQSLMTGEPYAVEKRPGACAAAEPAEAFSAVFAGTAVVSGAGTMVVTAIGAATRFGEIAADLVATEPPTAFERGLRSLGVLILRLTVFLVLFVLLAHLAFARPPLESFLFAVALAVGLTPELLPMVVTVTLARGALRLAHKRVIVKKLAAIHDLGAMDVFATDKTGTLTRAEITLVDHLDADGRPSARVLELAAVNARFCTGIRTPLDRAILSATAEGAEKAHDLARWTKLDEVPFDFERRRAAVAASEDGRPIVVVKGAAEAVLDRVSAREGPDGTVIPLDTAEQARLLAFHEVRAGEGERLLAVAYRAMDPGRTRLTADDETDLVFCGWCVFLDPPKPSAARAIGRLAEAGVRVKVISGDAPAVVRHLVGALGLRQGGLLTGAEIADLDDTRLAVRVDEVDYFARVSPDQKMRIITALKRRGHTVGFMGDGINDAPAIRAADVGLSVDGATDVAREAADMILTAADLAVVADGVEEGRRTFANILKYVRMGTSSNFGNMLSMAAASLFIPFLPLTPVQILINNLIYDVSEIGIPFDAVDAEETATPHAWDMAALLRFTVIMGLVSSLFDGATFAVLRLVFDAAPEVFRTAWFVESMATQILVIFVIRSRRAFWRGWPHPVLTATSLGALAVAIGLALTPIGAVAGFHPLGAPLLGAVAALVVGYFLLAEAMKGVALGPIGVRDTADRRAD